MNSILIGLGSDLANLKPIMSKIEECSFYVEVACNVWLVESDNDLTWWNNNIFEIIKYQWNNIDTVGSIKKSYFICPTTTAKVCGLMDKKVTTKIREFKESRIITKKDLSPIKNLLDRMELEE